MVSSPEDALSMRHLCTILIAYTQVSIANTTLISPFLDIRLHYQSPAMPRCHIAAFAMLKVEWVM